MLLFFKIKNPTALNLVHMHGKVMGGLLKHLPQTKTKFIMLSSDASTIRKYLLPLLFIMKLVRFFAVYFRFLTLRSTSLLGKELKYLMCRRDTCVILGPLNPLKVPINLLVRFKIPFIFSASLNGHHWSITKYSFLNTVFGLHKVQRLRKLYLLNYYVFNVNKFINIG